jgi:hypothetical protein
LALPAGGRDKISPFWRNWFEPKKTLENAHRTRQSSARFVGRTHGTTTFWFENKYQTHLNGSMNNDNNILTNDKQSVTV